MEGNKDEAFKCLRIGKHALQSGDRGRALKFLSKARRLDPTLPVDDLLSAAREAEPHDPPSAVPSEASHNEPEPEPEPELEPNASSSSSPAAKASPPSDGSTSSIPYTEEQITIVRQIKKQKDYYQILGLERSCTVEDVRKAYRKLSLKVHPDKNKAPGADEAFKAVSRAFQCLSNEETRKRYDLVGSEEPNYGRPAARNYHTHTQGFNGFYEGDIDADEIFRNFFFGGMPPVAATFGPFGFRAGPTFHGGHGSSPRTLVQILPVIILLLVNILPAFFPSPEPVYMLSRSYEYNHKFETPRGVPYFVKSTKYEEEYPYESSERVALENRIERDYIGILNQNCHVELQRRQWGLTNQMPHCDMLQKFREAEAA